MKTKKIYKGFEVSTDDDFYRVERELSGGFVEVRRFDFGKQEFKKSTMVLRKLDIARDLKVDLVFFELTEEEKRTAIEEAGLSILTGKELNELDKDQDGNKLNRHFDWLYYVSDNGGNLETWEQPGSCTEAEAIDEALYMLKSGDLD